MDTHIHTRIKHTPKQRGDSICLVLLFLFVGGWMLGGVNRAQNAILSVTKQQDSHSCVTEVKMQELH
jgi:hypothetical protein